MLCYWGGGGGGGELEAFNVEQRVAQGCSLSPILFSVFINGLFVAVEQAGLCIELSDRGKVGGLLFADVQSTILQEMTLCVNCRSFLGIDLNI